jgi:hypothetical protein
VKNPSPYIRTQLFTLLSGAVLYESLTIPVFEGDGNAIPYKIVIEDEEYSSWRTKVSANFNGTQRIEVIHQGQYNVKKHADAIRSLVLDLIEPNLTTSGIPNSEDWQVTNLIATPKQMINDLAEDGSYIIRAPIELEFFITQRN